MSCKNNSTLLLFFTVLFLSLSLPASAQLSNIEKQNQIIRQQQNILEKQKRDSEFERIKKEREKLLEDQKKEEEVDEKEALKLDKCFKINKITFEGDNLLSKRAKKKIQKPFLDKCFDSLTFSKLVGAVNSYYQDQGFTTTQVIVPKQNIASGELNLQIIEGKIANLTIGEGKFTDKMQKFTAFGLIDGKKLNINDVNQGLHQMNRLQSNNAAMKIEPAEEVGFSNILIDNDKKFPAIARVNYDNLGNEFTGVRRTTFSSTIDNALFLNDQIDLSYSTNLDDPSSKKDLRSFSAGFSIPFKYNTFTVNHSRTKFQGTSQGNSNLIILDGYSNHTSIALDRTLLNNTKHRISTNLSLTTKESASYQNGVKLENSENKLTVANLSFSFSKYFKNGGNIFVKPSYSRGLKILNANQDLAVRSADTPKNQFQLYKIYASASKEFNIPKINLPVTLTSQMDSQISKDTLLGSEQFAVGGYYSVRGFRENQIVGDHGYYFRNSANSNLGQILNSILPKKEEKTVIKDNENFENNFYQKFVNILYDVNIEPFYDYGYTKSKISGDSGRLSGAGLKIIYSGKYFDSSLTYSWALNKSNLIDSDKKENKMLYFEVSLQCC